MFFEDVDLGWRLWLLGYEVRYVPASLVYHRHHASMSTVGILARALPARAQRAVHDLQELRRRDTCARVLPAAHRAGHRRGVARGGDDPPHARPRRTPSADEPSTAFVHKETLAGAVRGRRVRRGARRASARRARELQEQRRRADAEILPPVPAALPPEHPTCASFGHRYAAAVVTPSASRPASRRGGGSSSPPATRCSRRWPGPRSAPGRSPSAVAGARRRAREHHEVRGPVASRLPGPQGERSPAAPSSSAGATSSIFQGYIMLENPAIAKSEQGRRRRHLRPVPPRAARADARLGQADRRERRASRDRRAERAARARRLVPVRERRSSATSGSASSPRVGRINPVTYDDGREPRRPARRRARSA